MNTSAIEALTRHAGGLSRRGSLRLLGAAALASAVSASGVAKAGKKTQTRCQKRADPCQGQLEQCRSYIVLFCEGNADCEKFSLPCCEPLARCDAAEAFTCLFQVS
jgi:hypothetical protein